MWQAVRGPFGALVATLDRVSIVIKEPLIWILPDGTELRLLDLCPDTLLYMVGKAIEHWQAKQVSEHLGLPEFSNGLWLAPIKYRLGSSGLAWQQRGYLRSAVIGAQWPQ